MAFFSRYKLENSEIAWYGSPEPKMIIFVLATPLTRKGRTSKYYARHVSATTFFRGHKREKLDATKHGSPEPKMIIFVLATSLWHKQVVHMKIMQGMWMFRCFSECRCRKQPKSELIDLWKKHTKFHSYMLAETHWAYAAKGKVWKCLEIYQSDFETSFRFPASTHQRPNP
jgi:hypothetical protein